MQYIANGGGITMDMTSHARGSNGQSGVQSQRMFAYHKGISTSTQSAGRDGLMNRFLTLTLSNGSAVLIAKDNIVSMRDAIEGEGFVGVSSKIATVADFHFVCESLAQIAAQLEESK